MTEQEKKIMMIDLCARLAYGMKAQVCERNDEDGSCFYNNCEILGIKSNDLVEFIRIDDSGKEYGRSNWFNISWFKPYLRPMSSMTKEEKKYLENNFRFYFDECSDGITNGIYSAIFNRTIYQMINEDDISNIIDWLNAHHFDYRGLIEMGLALEAPNEMYNIK